MLKQYLIFLFLLTLTACASPAGKTTGRKALSTLEEAESCRKNHIQYRDSTALDDAIHWFEKSHNPHQLAQALYYRGLYEFQSGNYNKTVSNALRALDLSQESTDNLTRARAHELLADAYREVFNLKVARLHRRAAAEAYIKADKPENAFYATMDLAGEYSHEDNDSSHLLMKAAAALTPKDDPEARIHYLLTYADICRVREEYDTALTLIRRINPEWRQRELVAEDSIRIGEIYYHCGMPDSAMIWFNHEIAENSIQYWKCIADREEQTGNMPAALEALKHVGALGYHKTGTTLSNTLEYEEKTYYEKKAESERTLRRRLTAIAVGLCTVLIVLMLTIMLWRLYRRSKSLKAQNNIKDVALMQTVENIETLKENDNNYASDKPDTGKDEEDKWINVIIDFYMKRLNEISREYFKVTDPVRQKEIEIEFGRELRSLRSGDIFVEIERHLNERHDFIATRIRQQFPRFSEQYIRLMLCSLAGLSSQSTCLLLSIEKGNYYVMWTRIRARIRTSEVPDKELFRRLFLKE